MGINAFVILKETEKFKSSLALPILAYYHIKLKQFRVIQKRRHENSANPEGLGINLIHRHRDSNLACSRVQLTWYLAFLSR